MSDKRRTQRAVRLAEALAQKAGAGLPSQCAEGKSELVAAYRFYSNKAIDTRKILSGHLGSVMEKIRTEALVLCVQDTTELDYTQRQAEGLGEIGNGGSQGLMQHSALAILPEGRLLGVLHVDIHPRHKKARGETRRQSQSRPTEAQIWGRAAQSTAEMDFGKTRIAHVCDRGADCYEFLETCTRLGHDYVVRARHDRKTSGQTHLWEELEKQAVEAHYEVEVPAKKQNQKASGRRRAKLQVRYKQVQIQPPHKDPRHKQSKPIKLWAIYVSEADGLPEMEKTEWMLLSSLEVENAQQACEVISHYTKRWKIEEWHRCLKQGCRVEQVQLKNAQALANHAAMNAVVAVRLMQMRDAAKDGQKAKQPASRHVEPMHLKVMGLLLAKAPEQISMEEYWEKMARMGGWLGKMPHTAPGWITIWRGWLQIDLMAKGVALATSAVQNV